MRQEPTIQQNPSHPTSLPENIPNIKIPKKTRHSKINENRIKNKFDQNEK